MSQTLRFALLPIAALCFLVPVLPQFGFGISQAERALDQGIPPELPPGIFFSIWGIIFLGYAGFALFALLRPNDLTEKLTSPLVWLGVGLVIWMLSAQFISRLWLDFVLLFPVLFYAWNAAYRLDRYEGPRTPPIYMLSSVLIGLVSGWLAIATAISLPDLVRDLIGRGVTDAPWQSLWLALVPAAIMAWVFASYVSRNIWFFAALSWGLIGLIVNNWTRTQMHWLAIITAVFGLLIVWRRLRYGAAGSGARAQ